MSSIYIYWDESHFWGLMAIRALRTWGFDFRLVRGKEIAQGILKTAPPKLLLVPGGRAKGKADRLGPEGMQAVRDYVASGGTYLGFCGGAGLALSGANSLALCPWKRRRFSNRLQHFLSGHIHTSLNQSHTLVPNSLDSDVLLPVWWPGQFEPIDDGVEILATFGQPGPDFWVADLALSSLPKGTMADWEAVYGITLRPDFILGNPCVVTGKCGKGRYILSYAHLETPASTQANTWLAHLLGQIMNSRPDQAALPAWVLTDLPTIWHDPVLTTAREMIESTIHTGQDHLLLFWRTPWLLGWRRGIPGAGINALYALICESMASTPTKEAKAFWAKRSKAFAKNIELLHAGLTGFLLAERLAMTVFHSETDAVPGLKESRELLFGPPPSAGGVYGELLADLETLFHLL